jgi:hypothetical protein
MSTFGEHIEYQVKALLDSARHALSQRHVAAGGFSALPLFARPPSSQTAPLATVGPDDVLFVAWHRETEPNSGLLLSLNGLGWNFEGDMNDGDAALVDMIRNQRVTAPQANASGLRSAVGNNARVGATQLPLFSPFRQRSDATYSNALASSNTTSGVS